MAPTPQAQILTAERIRVAAAKSGLYTIAAVARAAGMSQSKLGRRMRGLVEFDAADLRQLAPVLQTTAKELLGDDAATEPKSAHATAAA